MIPAVKYKVTFFESPCWVDQDVSPRQGKRQSQERHWKPYGNSPNRACLYIASLLFTAQFYEMPGHRHRINRVINVQVNTLFTETFPTMVNLELPNFHKWSRLIVARDTFTTIPPVYFALFAKFSQMCQVDCCWRLGCPKKTFFLKFLFKLLKNIPWKYPFVSFLCQKSPVQKSKFCNINFWIGNDPPPLRNFSENSSVLVRTGFPKSWSWLHCQSENILLAGPNILPIYLTVLA